MHCRQNILTDLLKGMLRRQEYSSSKIEVPSQFLPPSALPLPIPTRRRQSREESPLVAEQQVSLGEGAGAGEEPAVHLPHTGSWARAPFLSKGTFSIQAPTGEGLGGALSDSSDLAREQEHKNTRI